MSSNASDLISAYRHLATLGLSPGKSGNLSVRHGSDVLVTPSAIAPTDITTSDLVTLTRNGEHVKGHRRATSEWRMHCAIYQTISDAQAVVHLHPPMCTSLARLHKSIPAFHYMVAAAGGNDIRCAEYALFGTQALFGAMLAALQQHRACLLASHGMIA